MKKYLAMLIVVLAIVLIEGCKNRREEPSPDLNLELNVLGEPRVGNDLQIKLAVIPASTGLGKEFLDTPVKVNFVLPDSFEITDGDTYQEVTFADFTPKTLEIASIPSKEGIFDVYVNVTKQNSGTFLKKLTLDIEPPETGPQSPEINVDGNITDFIKNFLEPAPDGYKWEYNLDWDKTVIQKCLVNSVEKDGQIDDDTYTKIKTSGQPKGYWWTTEQKLPPTPGPNINIKLCLSRLECPYGKIPNKQECIVPR